MLGPVLDPVKQHVDGFRPFLFDGVVCKTFSGGVINTDRGGPLGMSKFDKGGTTGDIFLAVEECGSDFGFRGRRHNVAHYLVGGMYEAVEGRIGVGSTGQERGEVAQKVVPTGVAL